MFRSFSEVYRPAIKSQTSKIQLFPCDICEDNEHDEESFWSNETELEFHRKAKHSELIMQQKRDHPERFCTVCMTLQDSEEDLLRHLKTRHLYSSPQAQRVERDIFVCDKCSYIFFNKLMLEAHMLRVHLWEKQFRKTKTFQCPRCLKTCRLVTFWFHMQLHDIPSVSACDICIAHCTSIADLMAHVKEHNAVYRCEACNYGTTKESLFKSHLGRHKPDKSVERIPPYMKTTFSTNASVTHRKSYLGQMKYNIHNVVKGLLLPPGIHICVLCREICTGTIELVNHLYQSHRSVLDPPRRRALRCRCGEYFPSRVFLRQHVLKLTGLHEEDIDDEDSKASQANTTEPTNEQNESHEQIKSCEQNESRKENISCEQKKSCEENKSGEQVEQIASLGQNTLDLSSGVEVEIHQSSPASEETHVYVEMAEDSEMRDDKDTSQLMYIYAMVNDDNDLVSMEDDEEEIFGRT